jgi:C1A family cysteine protease
MAKKLYTRVSDRHDPRDRRYTRHLMKMGDAPLPPQVDLRPFCSPVEDQGDTSSCTGHAIIGAVEIDENFARLATPGQPFVNYSRLFVYYNEREMEGDTNEDGGAAIRDGIKSLATFGVCEESYWPFNVSNLLLKPSMEAYQAASKHKALSYESVPQTLDALQHCLAVTNRPFVFGIDIFDSFESDAVAASGIVPMPGYREHCLGGHAILAVGYDNAAQCFICRNSWGPAWGDRGYFHLPYNYVLNTKLAEDFWVVEAIS